MQTFWKLSNAKYKVRQLLLNLEHLLNDDARGSTQINMFHSFLQQHPMEESIWYPFGRRERRVLPRLFPPELANKNESPHKEHLMLQSDLKQQSDNGPFRK